MFIKQELLDVLLGLGLTKDQIIELANRLQANADQHQQAVIYYENQKLEMERLKEEAELKRDAALDMIAKISV